MSYSQPLLHHFFSPQYVGDLIPASSVYRIVLGTASADYTLQWDVRYEDLIIQQAVFKAYGSPPIIACADYLCAKTTGKTLAEAARMHPEAFVTFLQLSSRQRYAAVLMVEAIAQLRQKVGLP